MPERPAYDARVPFKTVDGHDVHLEVWLPKGANGPVPVLAWLHGGGMYDGAAGDFADTQLFPTLDKGWAFASFEYRLAPQVSLSDIVADVTDACGFVQSGKLDQKLGGGKVDGHRFVLSGSSAGGALALAAGFQLPVKPKAIFALYPPTNLTHPSYTKPVQFPEKIEYDEISKYLTMDGPVVSHAPANVDFSIMHAEDRTRAAFWVIQEGKVMEMATRSTDPAEHAKYSAHTHVSSSCPPTVIAHGNVDLMVPFELSEVIVADLKKAGVDAQLIPVEGENHGFDLIPGAYESPERMKPFKEAYEFLSKYV